MSRMETDDMDGVLENPDDDEESDCFLRMVIGLSDDAGLFKELLVVKAVFLDEPLVCASLFPEDSLRRTLTLLAAEELLELFFIGRVCKCEAMSSAKCVCLLCMYGYE